MSIRKNIALAAVGVIVIAGFGVGAIALHDSVAVHTTHVADVAPTPDPITTVPVDTTVNPEVVDGPADVAAEQAAAAAALLAAQQAAAAQVAAEAAKAAAAKAADSKPSDEVNGQIVCPAGSQANSGDSAGATSCFPDVCFHVTLPDPAYPQCVTAFKP